MKRLDHYWYSQNPVAWLLWPVSLLFCSIVFIRQLFYRTGLLKTPSLAVPVVVIGNISVGGTGKTPLLISLCKELRAMGYKPGVITRGYGGHADQWPQLVLADSSAAVVGDEPVMIAASTQCPVVAGPDRVQDVEMLLDKHDCNIILSDDGLQHYRLHRDIEIAVIDARRQMGNGFCLPAGPLREPSRRLKTVDMVIYNGGTQAVSYTLEPGQLVSLADGNVSTLEFFQGQTVHAVAAIGHPQRFFDLLEKHGLHLIKHSFADHYLYQEEDLVFNDDLPILMTEKDAVKCTGFNISNSWYLPVTATLSADAHSQFKQLIKQVCNG